MKNPGILYMGFLRGWWNKMSLIDKLDGGILSFHEKIAKTWQNKTYTSKDRLASYLYGASSLSFLGGSALRAKEGEYGTAAVGGYLSFLWGKKAFKDNRRLITGRESEISSEAISSARKSLNRLMAGGYVFLVTGYMPLALVSVGMGLHNRDPQLLTAGCKGTLDALGGVSVLSGLYIDRVDAGKPPKKPKKKPLVERVRSQIRKLLPRPQPVPLPKPAV